MILNKIFNTYTMSTNKKLKNAPECQNFQLDGVRHISASVAHELLCKHQALLLDVREKDEYEVERIALPDVLHYPMTEVIDNIQDLPSRELIIAMDSRGERGTKVANMLLMQGFTDVANLDGGLLQWKAGGFPVEDILPEACGGCCGCG